MFLALAGALLVGLPGVLLGVWFSWLTRRRWLRGGALLVLRTWLVVLTSIAGGVTILCAPLVQTGFGLAYNALVCFCTLAVAGGIPSAVIALAVSSLTYWLDRDPYESKAPAIIATGTVSGIVAGLFTLRLGFAILDLLWHQ
ncbi:MAG: hypothetical protein ACYC6Y_25640 [Thermoguttaceae bacterium]